MDCRLLEPLFEGSTGLCHLGMLESGASAGRPALLRPLPAKEAAKIERVLPILQVLSRPSSTKILGLSNAGEVTYVASEYIEGASLLELEQAARAEGSSLSTPVIVRAIRDALMAAHATQSLLAETGGIVMRSTLSAESIWLAEYGEVYLTELGVIAGLFASAPPRPGAPARGLDSNPMRAAGAELTRLLVTDAMLGAGTVSKRSLPEVLSSVLDMAVSTRPGRRFAGPATMAEALSALPSELIADNARVAEELSKYMGPKLARRKASRAPAQVLASADRDETRHYDLAGVQGSLRDAAARARELHRAKKAAASLRADAPKLGVPAKMPSDGAKLEPLASAHGDGFKIEPLAPINIDAPGVGTGTPTRIEASGAEIRTPTGSVASGIDVRSPTRNLAFGTQAPDEPPELLRDEVTRHYNLAEVLSHLDTDTQRPPGLHTGADAPAPASTRSVSTPLASVRASERPTVPPLTDTDVVTNGVDARAVLQSSEPPAIADDDDDDDEEILTQFYQRTPGNGDQIRLQEGVSSLETALTTDDGDSLSSATPVPIIREEVTEPRSRPRRRMLPVAALVLLFGLALGMLLAFEFRWP